MVSVADRAHMYAALGDPVRLAIVDHLLLGDAAPGELGAALGVATNLLAHHLRVLDEAGLIRRVRSEGDRRRSYVQLALDNPVAASVVPGPQGRAETLRQARRVVFVCTQNSARSQFAAAAWALSSDFPSASAGTTPASKVHPTAVRVGRRHGLELAAMKPARLEDVIQPGDFLVAVCDNAYEELAPGHQPELHWAVRDPAPQDSDEAFENAYGEILQRVSHLAETFGHKGAA